MANKFCGQNVSCVCDHLAKKQHLEVKGDGIFSDLGLDGIECTN
jgi:hypothetical protein